MPVNGNLLVTCGGKWVGIVLQLREAMLRNSLLAGGGIVVASSDSLTPAGCFADAAVRVPPISDPGYIDSLLRVCQEQSVRIVVPLIDLDLARLAPHVERFARIGTTVICPPPDLVAMCFDKVAFAEFSRECDLPHPATRVGDDLTGLAPPFFYKRRLGFGSLGSGVCSSVTEALELASRFPDLIFQEYLPVEEVTVDAYISRDGACIVCVPRIRDKVVGGESYKTHTFHDPAVVDLAMRTIDALAERGLRGPLNVQMFRTDPPVLMEVNTRLGSASVLSNMACQGRLLDALLHEGLGGTSTGTPGDFTVGMALSRFMGDVFHVGDAVVDMKPRRS